MYAGIAVCDQVEVGVGVYVDMISVTHSHTMTLMNSVYNNHQQMST